MFPVGKYLFKVSKITLEQRPFAHWVVCMFVDFVNISPYNMPRELKG